ncbi:MAG TPA: SDR family oxidoreductase [Gemmatimonadaceae bacterium]|nr:SDR family oxidoreductase [Gemmatimonadaceae bacterium]
MELQAKVALVTGAGIRVGRVLALTLAQGGARVAVHYNSSDGDARETVRRITANGGTAELFQADLSAPGGSRSLIQSVVERMGALDILVNSAAVMVRTPFGEITRQQWDDIFALNLAAPFFLSQEAAPILKRARGAIVNIADLAAYETWPAYIPHGLTKGGIVQMTRALARVMAPEVRVNAIAPGTVLLPEDMSQRESTHLVETTPLKRNGTPEDVASAMMFLLRAEYITGETIIVDGGRHVRR